ncbi:MAG: universal stress protein [Nitrospirota bacterium]
MNTQKCPFERLEKILLATDRSRFSEGAIREALSLSRRCSSKLIAISVVKTNLEFEMNMPQVIDQDEAEAMRHLETVRTKALEDGIDCEIITLRGEETYQEIVSAAGKDQADIIIMGRHGRTGLLRLMMGSVTAKVIGHAPCNILVVPPDAKVDCKQILIATDGSKYSETAAREAIGIAKRSDNSLVAVSVASSDIEIASAKVNVAKVEALATEEGIKIEGLTPTGKPYEAIVETAKQKNTDLIVLGSRGRTGLERLLMGSVAERVIGHTETAVLVAPKQNKVVAR